MRPGGFLWFARHDLRLAGRRMRAFFGKTKPATIALLLGVALALFHALGWVVANRIAEDGAGDPQAGWPSVAMALVFIVPWIVSQALTNATRALYSRGDLDIVLASPMSARSLFVARAAAIALESIGSVAIFTLPIANMMALLVGARWLAIYPALLAAGFFGTGLGLFATMGLFRLCGPQRTRLVAQVAATLIGAGFALGLQVANVMPESALAAFFALVDAAEPGGLFDRASLWWLPVRAAAGQPAALALWGAASLAVFFAAALLLARAFAAGALSTAGAGASQPRARRRFRFRGGAGASLRRKEWRLISRDPWLASQILLQVIYTMPVSVVLWRAQGPDGSIALSIAPALVVVAAHISASLAWLAISSEDAPEFLASAPVTRGEIERRKLEAIAGPLALLFAAPLIGMWMVMPKAAYLTLAFALCAAASTALLNLWHPVPGRRGDLMRRHSQSKLVGMIEHALSLFWATALALAAYRSLWALAPSAAALALLWANRPKNA